MTGPDAVLETALYAEALDEAAGFYAEVIGLNEHSRMPDRHVFFECGPGMVMLFNPAATAVPGGKLPVPPHGAHGPGHVCFRVPGDALDAWTGRFRDHDVEIEADFHWPNGARSIYVRDPAQNSVEISEPKLWGRPV